MLVDDTGTILRPNENSAQAAPEALFGEVDSSDALDKAVDDKEVVGEVTDINIFDARPGSLGTLKMVAERFFQPL